MSFSFEKKRFLTIYQTFIESGKKNNSDYKFILHILIKSDMNNIINKGDGIHCLFFFSEFSV